LFNLNFNQSFNQTYIFPNRPQLKVLFIKQLFSNHNHNSYHNTKHTLKWFQNTVEHSLCQLKGMEGFCLAQFVEFYVRIYFSLMVTLTSFLFLEPRYETGILGIYLKILIKIWFGAKLEKIDFIRRSFLKKSQHVDNWVFIELDLSQSCH
jgi:hypothetical protein